MSESDLVAKNRIEFQWGSKLTGTSSEALGYSVKFSWYYMISEIDSKFDSCVNKFSKCKLFDIKKNPTCQV